MCLFHPKAWGVIYRQRVGWTVYFYVGVWRCLQDDKSDKSRAFLSYYCYAKFGDSGGNTGVKITGSKVVPDTNQGNL